MEMLIKPAWEDLLAFATESDEIENIYDEQRHQNHASMLSTFLQLEELAVGHLRLFVETVAPGAKLRDKGERVRVGNWIPPDGDKAQVMLKELLKQINRDKIDPYHAHIAYENIHPFMDGNGRSGRAVWLWMMVRGMDLLAWNPNWKFLQAFYYQTLNNSSVRMKKGPMSAQIDEHPFP